MLKNVVLERMHRLINGADVFDDIQVFIKQEPHKLRKIEEGRFRLISGVSFVDGIIDRIVFGWLADAAMNAIGQTPALLGWNPLFGGDRLLFSKIQAPFFSLDKSLWDWTVPAWLVDLWLQFILGLYHDMPEWLELLIVKRFNILFAKSRFRFPDGCVIEQKFSGIMKSGCFLTILLNSVGQYLVDRIVSYNLNIPTGEILCYGDDTIQEVPDNVENYISAVRALGFLPKDPIVSNVAEFVGFVMDGRKVIPAYYKKHLYNLRHLDEKVAEATLENYQILYADSEELLPVIQAELTQRNPTRVIPRVALQRVVRG
ncbi:hypothetical protein 2 [Hubei sobemo-like virus 11]|uniref:hypothetical protein 2 n=1 Tax=Hubei sobemo-like virus 11 TaxID=1923196 RepID=UPI00090B5E1C|nr:hypothetical protein 2 [Hubei sobemo-like virus 11]APG75834.1 hypothetical protein 2 [Hubei sobemo-like virus 11]